MDEFDPLGTLLHNESLSNPVAVDCIKKTFKEKGQYRYLTGELFITF